MQIHIVMLRQNVHEPSDSIDSVWKTEQEALERVSTLPSSTAEFGEDYLEYEGYWILGEIGD